MNNLFLTGQIGIGKSTLLKKIIEKINLSIGGYITEKAIKDSIKIVTVRSLYDSVEKHTIAKINTKDASKKVFVNSFNSIATSILHMSLNIGI